MSIFSDRTNWKLSPNRLTQALEEARAGGNTILDLSASNPTRIGLTYDASAILGALASPKSMDYDPQSKGLRAAREGVANYYRDEHAVGLDPERLVLTTSTSEGYSYVFGLLCNPGDELLVPKPSYPLFDFLADLEDVKLVPYPLIYDHGWQMDFPSLERAVTPRTRGVVIVHPNNPTGSYVQNHELTMLNAFCHRHRLALIVDEVFLDYAHDGNKRRTFAANEDVLTFTLSGLSKISALPQMKIAWVAMSGPAEAVDTAMSRLEVIADTYLSMNAPMQWAMPVLSRQRQSVQKQLLDRVLANLAELDRQSAAQKTCRRLNVEGGWYAVLRVPATKSDEDWAIELLREKSVLLHPGHFYDFPSDGHLVLSLIAPTNEFLDGIGRLLQHIEA